MRKILHKTILATLLVGFAVVSPAAADVTLSFGVYASDKPSAMVRQFRPVLNVLEDRMTKLVGEPVEIRLQVAKTYEQGIDDLVLGKVDFARFGPASYIEAKDADAGVTILAVESKDGTKVFNGVIAVAKDSSAQSIEDLRGKSFAFGDQRSTIGRYLSQLYLLRHGIHAADLKHFDYLGRHDKVGYAVGSGQFDAGALKESTFNKLVDKGVPIRVIGRFPNVTKPWIARSGLDENVRKALQTALFQIKDEEALKALTKDGFLEGDDRDYAFIREAILSNHLFEARSNTAQNTN